MRASFFDMLVDLSKDRDDLFVLTADLGFKLFDTFKSQCSDRFYDVGVAEANMIGIAAGLSLTGRNVFCYSIIPFLVMRAYEQIRIDIAYHNLNVKLVGVGGGFTYGMEGITHFGLEDLALMRSLQNMSIVVPADLWEARKLARIACDYPGPLYIRLGRTGEPQIHEAEPAFEIGKPMILRDGKQIALICLGNMVHIGLQVADLLQSRGLSATLVNMHTLKPVDAGFIRQLAGAHEWVFTLEEHNVHGGIGSLVAEVLIESSYRGSFKRFGIPDLEKVMGNADYLRAYYGLTTEKIAERILTLLH